MTNIAIRVENISKRYRLGEREPYKSIRDVIARATKISFRNFKQNHKTESSLDNGYFWALKDISFEISRGEALGIIGSNGAGKSTLLKILSRITKPTQGTADIYGRVGSLLEVGTGFHPELTGRENIYLNGAILGMRRHEIRRKFDEIVDFSGIATHLDTPVKRYSSGMYVRLAFAVAAHLEPEILMVDEVLAVGDAAFQKKCLGKMSRVTGEGRTILFVSHNMGAIKALCSQALLLEKGKILSMGPTAQVVEAYTRAEETNFIVRKETRFIKWSGIKNLESIRNLSIADDILMVLQFQTFDMPLENVFLDCELYNARGERVIHTKTKYISEGFNLQKNRKVMFKYVLKNPRLAPGEYTLSLYLYAPVGILLWIDGIQACSINSSDPSGKNAYLDTIIAAVLPEYSIEQL
jgi:lipopolysaccharide transport system ATP-binding protein